MFRYERRSRPILSRQAFRRRLVQHGSLAFLFVAGSLAIGMAGYHAFEHLGWVDAFLNASMILGGMGPVDLPKSEAGKLFAGLYALYSGLAFLVTAGLVFAPVLHRILHRFHLDANEP